MTLMIDCQEVRKAIGPRTLFNSLTFTLNKGDRLAIIGANGCGKTTLLRLLAELDVPDSGKINRSQNISVGYLPQQETFDAHKTVAGTLLKGLHRDQLDDAEKHNRVYTILSRAGFENSETKIETLSGGWRKRLAIALSLVQHPDVLVMDEPTNHLDLAGIVWLEKLLNSRFTGCPSTFVIVSHDRFFLENLATGIIEIAPYYTDGYLQTKGNYSSFLRQKEKFLLQQEEQETRLANKVRRETEWLNRGPKARTSKARFRIQEAHRLAEELGHLKSRNKTRANIEIGFDATGRKTKKLLEVKNLAKSYNEESLFSGVDLVLSPGSRIGLLGKNGSGKSTLMQILAGVNDQQGLQPDQGSIKTAEKIQIVYFAQDRKKLNQEQTLRQALSPEGDSILYRNRPLHVITWAQKFLFRTDQLDTPVRNLSGGEKARILIADIMRQPADILLLDEPTNDLDIPSLQVLEESLLDFPGAVVLVTHDRYLLNKVCDQVLGFSGHGQVIIFADYEQWHRSLEANVKTSRQLLPPKQKKQKQTGRLSYLDQREYDTMETTILEAEEQEQEILKVMDNPENASDQSLLEEAWEKLEEVRERISQLYERWDELERKKERGS